MKPGAKYEQFVFDKLQRLFPEAEVRLNDWIHGRESGLDREIDVSIRMEVGDAKLLYVVQCKDWETRVDINTLGAFAAVMQDVGAAKGFLLCTSGFWQTNHQYALARGIELITIEDVESDRWSVEVRVPLVYVRKQNQYLIDIRVLVNEALAALNCDRELTVTIATNTPVRVTGRDSPATLEAYLAQRVAAPTLNVREGVECEIGEPGLEMELVGVWVGCSSLRVDWRTIRTRYLKYLTPTEYSQLRDHVRGTTLPLYCKVEGVRPTLDGTFVEMAPDAPSEFPGFWLEVEESKVVARPR